MKSQKFFIFITTLTIFINADSVFGTDFFMANVPTLSKPRGNIKILHVTDTTVNLKWNCEYNEKNYHIISHNMKNKTSRYIKHLYSNEISTSNIEKQRITDLEPGCLYKFEILCLNMGKVSNEEEIEFSRLISREIITNKPSDRPAKPKGPFQAFNIKYKELTLRWIKPDNITTAMYKITWTKTNSKKENSTIIHSQSEYPQYKITGLKAGKRYNFQVQSYNNKGTSDSLVLEEIVTKHPLDSAIDHALRESNRRKIRTNFITYDAIQFVWNKPKSNSFQGEYGIFIADREKHWYIKNIKDTSNNPKYTIQNLTPGGCYKLIINIIDDKNSNLLVSKAIKLDNPLDKPNPPRQPFFVKKITSTTAELQWNTPENSTRFIKYNIIWKEIDTNIQKTITIFKANGKSSFTITKLNPGKRYDFEISAFNNKGSSDSLFIKNFITKV